MKVAGEMKDKFVKCKTGDGNKNLAGSVKGEQRIINSNNCL